jgi:hypothetical protein
MGEVESKAVESAHQFSRVVDFGPVDDRDRQRVQVPIVLGDQIEPALRPECRVAQQLLGMISQPVVPGLAILLYPLLFRAALVGCLLGKARPQKILNRTGVQNASTSTK